MSRHTAARPEIAARFCILPLGCSASPSCISFWLCLGWGQRQRPGEPHLTARVMELLNLVIFLLHSGLSDMSQCLRWSKSNFLLRPFLFPCTLATQCSRSWAAALENSTFYSLDRLSLVCAPDLPSRSQLCTFINCQRSWKLY